MLFLGACAGTQDAGCISEIEYAPGGDERVHQIEEYDADEHLIAERKGVDADEDGVLDEVLAENQWEWTCW